MAQANSLLKRKRTTVVQSEKSGKFEQKSTSFFLYGRDTGNTKGGEGGGTTTKTIPVKIT